MEVRLRIAKQSDEKEVMALYDESKQIKGCTWDDHYPNKDIFDGDIRREALYILEDMNGCMIGCVSNDEDMAVQELSCWNQDMRRRAEFARVAVKSEYQGNGYAALMISKTIDVLKEKGYDSACYLVSPYNDRALKAYSKLDFKKVGEAKLFDKDWHCYELIF